MRLRALLRCASAVAPLPAWALLGGVYLTAMLLNSARWHYGPDTRFYLAWAYRFGGLSEIEAGRRTYDFLNPLESFAGYCWNACDTSLPGITYEWLFRGEEGGLFVQRLVYPLLSAPFVRLFGPPGMLVVPALAFTAYVIMTVVLANRLLGRRWAVPAGIAAILPITLDRFALYAYTEALATAFLVACVLMLPLRREGAAEPGGGRARQRGAPPVEAGDGLTGEPAPVGLNRRRLIAFAVLLVLFAFTRQFHHVVVAGVVVTWLGVAIRQRRQKSRSLLNPWAPFAAVGVGVAIVVGVVQALMSPGYSLLTPFLEITKAESIGGIPEVLPGVIRSIIAGEVQTAGQDFGLVLIAVLGAAGIVAAWRTEFAWLTVGIFAGTFGLLLITALPSQNRYWALSVPLLAIHATAFVARVLTRDDRPAAETPSGQTAGEASARPATA